MNKPDQIQLVKAQLARKAMEAKKHKLSPPQNLSPKKATAKPVKNPAFFDPDAFRGDQSLHQLGKLPKGKQPDWVKEKYGSND